MNKTFEILKIKISPSSLPPDILEHKQDLCSYVTLNKNLRTFFLAVHGLAKSGLLSLLMTIFSVAN